MPLQGPDLIDPPAAPQPSPKETVWRIVRISLGILLLVLGIAGLVLPILQGWLMIFAAMAILRKDLPWAAYVWDRWLVPLRTRFQRWLNTWRRR